MSAPMIEIELQRAVFVAGTPCAAGDRMVVPVTDALPMIGSGAARALGTDSARIAVEPAATWTEDDDRVAEARRSRWTVVGGRR